MDSVEEIQRMVPEIKRQSEFACTILDLLLPITVPYFGVKESLKHHSVNLRYYYYIFVVLELSSLHTRHLNRPTLDDSIDEEHVIEDHTSDITKVTC